MAGYLAQARIKWEVVFWVLLAFGAFCLALTFFTLPYLLSQTLCICSRVLTQKSFLFSFAIRETYAPVLLVRRARRLRQEHPSQPWFASRESQLDGERVS